jgi:hypothetical protein
MAALVVKDSGLCATCQSHGLPTAIGGNFTDGPEGSTYRIIESRDLCSPCKRKTKSSYVEAVRTRREDIMERLAEVSPWLKKNPRVKETEEV